MADSGQGFFYSQDDQAALDSERRKRAYAAALMQEDMPRGAYGGLASAGNKILGAILANRADDKERAIAKDAQSSVAKSLAEILAPKASGPVQMDENGAAIPQPQGGGQGDIISRIMASGNPALISQFGPSLINTQLNRQEDDRIYNRTRADTLHDKQVMPVAPEDAMARGYRPGSVVSRDAFGKEIVNQKSDLMSEGALAQKLRVAEAGRSRLSGGGAAGKSVQSSRQLNDGTVAVLYRDGTSERLNIDGTPVVGAQYDPNNTFQRAAANAGGRAAGVVAESLPTAEAAFSQINRSLDAFDKPEIKAQADRALGPFDKRVPSVAGYNAEFNNQLKQVEGQTFLQAFNALRGAGQITEVEGSKATNALTRMQNASSAKEFYTAKEDAKTVFDEIQSAIRQRAGRGAVVPQLGGQGAGAQPRVLRFNPATGTLE